MSKKNKRGKNISQRKKKTTEAMVPQPHHSPNSALSTTAEGTLLPKEHQLYLQCMLLWHAGDWQGLAALDTTSLIQHSQQTELISLKAVAHFQLGESDAAKAILKQLPQQTRNSVRILISGAFNTLARARASLKHIHHAKKHFEKASLIGTITDSRVLIQANWFEQLAQTGIYSVWSPNSTLTNKQKFNVKLVNKVALGEAWAGNTVNTVIFRHHGVFSHNGMQYTAFYFDSHTLRLAQRNLSTNEVIFSDIAGSYNIKDAHNSISLGMDRNGYIHISYDHHGTQLKYRRSLKPYSIEDWSDELEMTGKHESKVTYPAFLMSMADEPFQILYRDGNHQKGSAFIKQYSETEQCWFDPDSAILSGATNQPWTSNAYWNHPVRDSEGSVHISFVWRTHSIGEQQQINNMNICYAKSFDNGRSWYSSNNKPFKLPITQVNAEVIWPVPPASNLINQTSMATDSQNRPHIVYYANDEHGIVQYQHLWFDGKRWKHQIISNRTIPFDLCGGGTLRIPISRPEIVIDKQDNIFVIYRGDLTGDCMAALCLKAPSYHYKPTNQQIIYAEPLGLAEPVIDRLRWQQEQVLSLIIQYNDQPDHDIDHTNVVTPIYLIDVAFNI